jgi:hypothetical protein
MVGPENLWRTTHGHRENQVCFDAVIGFAAVQSGYEPVFP